MLRNRRILKHALDSIWIDGCHEFAVTIMKLHVYASFLCYPYQIHVAIYHGVSCFKCLNTLAI